MGVLSEFKAFAVKGNVVDMAVGIIIGAAFGKIVSSFVGDVIMPPIGLLIGGVDFSDLAITLKAAEGNAPAVVLAYGKFIQSILDFVIVAFAIFMGVKAINRLKREEAVAPSCRRFRPRKKSCWARSAICSRRRTIGLDGFMNETAPDGAVFLPVIFHRHLTGPPRQAQAHVALLQQRAGVIDHLRIAAQHDPRVLGVSSTPASRSSSPLSINVVMRPFKAPGCARG
jgi:large conductance mechanosensitive channel